VRGTLKEACKTPDEWYVLQVSSPFCASNHPPLQQLSCVEARGQKVHQIQLKSSAAGRPAQAAHAVVAALQSVSLHVEGQQK